MLCFIYIKKTPTERKTFLDIANEEILNDVFYFNFIRLCTEGNVMDTR